VAHLPTDALAEEHLALRQMVELFECFGVWRIG
jgi:hypothetical protein